MFITVHVCVLVVHLYLSIKRNFLKKSYPFCLSKCEKEAVLAFSGTEWDMDIEGEHKIIG